jgi:hypothetical protein
LPPADKILPQCPSVRLFTFEQVSIEFRNAGGGGGAALVCGSIPLSVSTRPLPLKAGSPYLHGAEPVAYVRDLKWSSHSQLCSRCGNTSLIRSDWTSEARAGFIVGSVELNPLSSKLQVDLCVHMFNETQSSHNVFTDSRTLQHIALKQKKVLTEFRHFLLLPKCIAVVGQCGRYTVGFLPLPNIDACAMHLLPTIPSECSCGVFTWPGHHQVHC